MRALAITLAMGMFLLGGSVAAAGDKAPPAPKASASAKPKRLTDSQIKRLMIKESIDAYPGNCPCPYNSASNGSSCAGRSAWSRAGGAEPLCYPSDISADMVAEYRATHPEA